MREYKNKNPKFTDSINLIEPTDTNHADNVIAADICNFENTLANKESIEKLSDKVNKDTEALNKQSNQIHEGVNLVEKFKKEIRNFSDEWAWIKDRIEKNNYQGLHVGDYIPLVLNNAGSEQFEMQIAGIDTYTNTNDTPNIVHHIDFISRNCMKIGYQWNKSQSNNGKSSSNINPYTSSDIFDTLLHFFESNSFPQNVKSVIRKKVMLAEGRFDSSGKKQLVNNSNNRTIVNVGPLWLPTEYEVFGSCIWGTPGWSVGSAIQYPIFANNAKSRIKKEGNDGTRREWWLATAAANETHMACHVGYLGYPDYGDVMTPHFVPLCFRIAAQ